MKEDEEGRVHGDGPRDAVVVACREQGSNNLSFRAELCLSRNALLCHTCVVV